MKIIIQFFLVLITTFLGGYNATSQVIPNDVQNAFKVKNEIDINFRYNSLDQEGINRIDVTLDNSTQKILDTVSYFQVKSNELRIYSQFLNPMKYKISVSEESLDDEFYTARQAFLTSAIGNLPVTPSGAARARGLVLTDMDKELLEALVFTKSIDPNFLSHNNNDIIDAKFGEIQVFRIQKELTVSFNKIFDSLLSIDSIKDIKRILKTNNGEIKDYKTKINNKVIELTSLRTYMDETATYINNSISKEDLKAYVLLKIDELMKKLDTIKSTYENTLKRYESYTELFKKFSNKELKTVGKSIRYELNILQKLTKSKKRKVTIKLEEYAFDSKEKTLKVKNTKTYILNFRRHRVFIPVVSSGVLYTNLSFASFGTETDDMGNTIVSRSSDETNEITLGAYLNMYLNNDWESPIFWQLGVGPSKEKPLFFLGAGISIGNRINISTGAVFTWFPKLNDLSEGDIISGTSIIENDISYEFRTTPKFYLGLNFDISKK